jgi:uncharacterized protein YbjQ (UPF0145 family)
MGNEPKDPDLSLMIDASAAETSSSPGIPADDFAPLDTLIGRDEPPPIPGDLPPADTLALYADEPMLAPDSLSEKTRHSTRAATASLSGTDLLSESPEHTDTLEILREVSENLSPASESVNHEFPFSVLIEGKLAASDQEKLIDLIKEADLGIPTLDLETQFATGKVLLPRISEFTAVLIGQAIRDCGAQISIGPAELIYPSTQSPQAPHPKKNARIQVEHLGDARHVAENLPIVTGSEWPGHPSYQAIDVISVSQTLRAQRVELSLSPEFDETVNALRRELRFRAYRKGAQAIVDYRFELAALGGASHYRLIVTGTAVKSS